MESYTTGLYTKAGQRKGTYLVRFRRVPFLSFSLGGGGLLSVFTLPQVITWIPTGRAVGSLLSKFIFS